jgi:hypothetical protein
MRVCARGHGLRHSFNDIRDTSRFVFWRRVLPSFKRIHNVPSLAVVSNILLVERNIHRRGDCWQTNAGRDTPCSCLPPSSGVGHPVCDLSSPEARERLQVCFLLLIRIWVVRVSIHPILEHLDRSTWKPSSSLPTWSLIILIKVVEASAIPRFHGGDSRKSTLFLDMILVNSV